MIRPLQKLRALAVNPGKGPRSARIAVTPSAGIGAQNRRWNMTT